MPRATYEQLIAEVRAQIAVDPNQAYVWLLDRARVMNAETAWIWGEVELDPPIDADGRYYALPEEVVWVEAVLAGGKPYQRSTLHALDARWAGDTGNTAPIYADGLNVSQAQGGLQIHPPTYSTLVVRSVADVEDAGPTGTPPFPTDFDQVLVDGAVAIGLARMDERFDSATYFDQRFAAGVGRLRRRRNAHIGRGPTAIRVVQ